jgi:hypothetical protein
MERCESCNWPLCPHGHCVDPICSLQTDCEEGGCEMDWEEIGEGGSGQ